MARDFRSLTPEVVEKLNEKWKDYGTVWTGVAESEPVTFRIPEQPLTRNCVTLVGAVAVYTLADEEFLEAKHLSEAVQYRTPDRNLWL
jgi:hypothetical protein